MESLFWINIQNKKNGIVVRYAYEFSYRRVSALLVKLEGCGFSKPMPFFQQKKNDIKQWLKKIGIALNSM